MKTVVFDFDGTIADSISVGLEIYNQYAPDYGLRVLDAKDVEQARDMTLWQVVEFMGAKRRHLAKYLPLFTKLVHEQAHKIKPFPGMSEVIKQLHTNGWQLFILSSNSEATIHKVLTQSGLSEYVHVLKTSKLFGKASALTKLRRQHKIDLAEAWVIGDETRDIQAANKVGARSIAVTWGFQSEKRLQTANPTTVVHKPAEILKILET